LTDDDRKAETETNTDVRETKSDSQDLPIDPREHKADLDAILEDDPVELF